VIPPPTTRQDGSAEGQGPFAPGEVPPKSVAWLNPLELIRTAYHALLSQIVTGYLDRREVQAALDAPPRLPVHSRLGSLVQHPNESFLSLLDPDADNKDLWIDFVADIGDSWDATYATLSLIGRAQLQVRGLPQEVPRGDILVLGGDLVYPTPNRDAYRARTRTAFEAALPEQPLRRAPTVLAIPGNHDWYDGLTAFLREFCQGGVLGGWKLEQHRSYFAAKLSHDWWLLGIDISLDSRIDSPQQTYFTDILLSIKPRPGKSRARVILCTAKPVWLDNPRYRPNADKNLAHFLDLLKAHHCTVAVILSGDTHHYNRYQGRDSKRQLVVAGGGGAYLQGTHQNLPSVTEVTELRSSEEPEVFEASPYSYPRPAQSRRLRWGALGLALRSRNWPFLIFAGTVDAIMTLRAPAAWTNLSILSVAGFYERLVAALQVSVPWYCGLTTVLVVALTTGVTIGCNNGARLWKGLWGAVHGLWHVALALFLMRWYRDLFTMGLDVRLLHADQSREVVRILTLQILGVQLATILAILVYVLVAGTLATTLLGAFLAISDRLFAWHTNEAFAVQSIFDYRNFVRMKIDKNGVLTLHPIGLAQVPRRWRKRAIELTKKEQKAAANDEQDVACYESGDVVLAPEAIESPIVIG
jgi:hypothetical protein